MRIDVIVNMNARRHRQRPSHIRTLKRTCEDKAELHFTETLDELRSLTKRIASRGTDYVFLSGGDGSFMAGVTALYEAFGESHIPRLALLPGGTVATIARNWGFTGNPESCLKSLLERRESLRTTRRPTLKVISTQNGISETRIGFIFGTGLVAKFFDVYYAEGARGYAGAARIVARIFAESFVGGAYARRVLDPMACRLYVNGKALEQSAWSLICAAVIRNLGIHMLVTYRAGEDLYRPHLVASSLSPHQLGPRAPLVLAGKSIGGKGHVDTLADTFRICFPEIGSYVLDGDILKASEIAVSAGPPIDVVNVVNAVNPAL